MSTAWKSSQNQAWGVLKALEGSCRGDAGGASRSGMMQEDRAETASPGQGAGVGWQGSTFPTKPNHPSSHNAVRLKITPEQHSKPPLGEGKQLPRNRVGVFPGNLSAGEGSGVGEGLQRHFWHGGKCAGGSWSLSIPVARQPAGITGDAAPASFREGRGKGKQRVWG